jgi:hypothetical protein
MRFFKIDDKHTRTEIEYQIAPHYFEQNYKQMKILLEDILNHNATAYQP